MSIDSAGFAEFYQATRDDCLRVVFASVGDRPTAEDLVAEAFARAWARWHTCASRVRGRDGPPPRRRRRHRRRCRPGAR